jgi:hypothetical protein
MDAYAYVLSSRNKIFKKSNKILHVMPDNENKSPLVRVLIVDDVESMKKANEAGTPYNLVISD